MKKIALGAALLLLSSAAYAQTSPDQNAGSAPQATQGAGTASQSSSDQNLLRKKPGSHSQMETTGAVRTHASGTQTKIRTHENTNTRVGVETRERHGVAVRSRTIRETEEPSVAVVHRRSVTSYEEPGTEVRHATVRKYHTHKKVAHKKPTHTHKVAVKSHRYRVVEEQPVEVRRRHVVRRYEESTEPSVSVHRRTTVRQTRETSPEVGVSVEQRRSATRSSGNVNVSTTRRHMTSPETTGSVSSHNRVEMKGGKATHEGTSSTKKLLPQQQGGSSSGGASPNE